MSITTRQLGPSRQRLIDPFDVMDTMDPFSMTVTGTGPFTALNRLSDQLTSPSFRQSMLQCSPILNADLIETETDYNIHCDLPGVNKEDLDITFSDGQMTVKAERKERSESATETTRKIERHFGKVQRTITIPQNADVDHCQACLKDGVLTVSFPKREVTQVKKITLA